MKILLLTIIVLTLATCTFPEQKESVNTIEHQELILPADWNRISAFSVEFYIPPDLNEKEEREMMPHSTAKFYGNENIWLVFTIQSKPSGSYRWTNDNSFQFEKTFIDGKPAEISTFTGTDMQNEAKGKDYLAVLDVPQIENEKSLNMWAYSKTPADRETVIKIFKSVRFIKK